MKPFKELTIGEIKSLTEEQIEQYGEQVKQSAIRAIREEIETLRRVDQELSS